MWIERKINFNGSLHSKKETVFAFTFQVVKSTTVNFYQSFRTFFTLICDFYIERVLVPICSVHKQRCNLYKIGCNFYIQRILVPYCNLCKAGCNFYVENCKVISETLLFYDCKNHNSFCTRVPNHPTLVVIS